MLQRRMDAYFSVHSFSETDDFASAYSIEWLINRFECSIYWLSHNEAVS